jgi:hypothetical protein
MKTATAPVSTPSQPALLNCVPKQATPRMAARMASLRASPTPMA